MSLNRRVFLRAVCAAGVTASWHRDGLTQTDMPDLQWHDVIDWGLEGRGWQEEERESYFDRFPQRAEGMVRAPVWSLSRHSAGMSVRFTTDANDIWVDYRLTSPRLEMPHMPATGVSGLDLYADTEQGSRWVQVLKPVAQEAKVLLASQIDPGSRTYTLYLPLYNGVQSLRIGVPSTASFAGIAPRSEAPMIFYGTSIMHGARASRPGMALPAILQRRFGIPAINLGFSGNGKMDPEVGTLLADQPARVFCIDCLPNMNPAQVRERTKPLVHQLRDAHRETPILLVEDRVFANAPFFANRRQLHHANHEALRESYDQLIQEGIQNLYYLSAENLIGRDGEGTTDGSHPNDLGFMRYADAYEQVLSRMLS